MLIVTHTLSALSLTESYFGGLLGPMLLIGVGVGLGFTAVNIAALTGTRKGEEGLASGLINTSRHRTPRTLRSSEGTSLFGRHHKPFAKHT